MTSVGTTGRGVHALADPPSPSCSVVISTRDRPEFLAECLRCIARQTCAAGEVVIVDSAPAVQDARRVAQQFEARYVLEREPGLSRARNRGARDSTCDVIVFVDDDVTMESGCLAALLEEFEDPRVSMVTGRLLLKGGSAEAKEAFEEFGAFDVGTARRAVDRDTENWFELANFGGLGVGALLAVRRSVLTQWAGFDERLGRGARQDCSEELLAFMSLIEGGHRVVYTPSAVAYHPAPDSLDELKRRVLDAATGATAYMTLLLVEYPRYRRRILAYVQGALRGRVRDWRPRPASARRHIVPSWREWAARARGPFVYLRMRLATRRRAATEAA